MLALAACAVPLGPGFEIEQQNLELVFEPGAPARVAVRAAFRVRNAGNRPLEHLEIALPAPSQAERIYFSIRLDGQELHPRAPTDSGVRSVVIPFAPSWLEHERRNLELGYTLVPGENTSGLNFAAANDAFHIRPYRCCPALLPPARIFAKGGERPSRIRYSVLVPEDFRVLAAGRARGIRRRGGHREHRFEVREDDVDPYVIAGRYNEQRFRSADETIVFWTIAPLDSVDAQRAAARLAATLGAYRGAFGPLEKRAQPVWLVETHARIDSARAADNAAERAAGAAFPRGALLNRATFALGVTTDAFLEMAKHELAHLWFGQALAARPEAELVLSEALADYAVLVAATSRGGDAARRRQAAVLLHWYDEVVKQTEEKPLLALRASDPWEQRRLAYSKGALFFVALEDELGRDAVRRALARLVAALRDNRAPTGEGRAGFAELRSALEAESGRTLADFFRSWLNRPGLPAGFRERYATTAEIRK